MNCLCPACGQPLPVDPVESRTDALRAACLELGLFVTWDDFVSERTAARMLGREPATLRNWRGLHRPLRFRKLSGRVEYPLAELARLLIEAEVIDD
jgi:hypothetical protein